MKFFNIDKEIEFINGMKFLIQKYGTKIIMNWYWKPQFYKNGMPIVDKHVSVDFVEDINKIHNLLDNPRKHNDTEKEKYFNKIDYIMQKLHFKLDDNISHNQIILQKASIYRYYIVGALNNISLSVSPEIKKKWNINFELFGAFYNTNTDYCGLFSDIENSCCDFFTFKLKKNMTILINPPYTKKWIQISCKIIDNIMNKNKNTKIYFVIPVWNNSDRKNLGLTLYNDLLEIDELKNSQFLQSHKIMHLDFYNGIIKKYVNLHL
jgi:hypothetical protein